MSDDPLHDRIVLGHRAAQLLGDDLLRDFLDDLERQITLAWTNSKTAEVATRERAWFALMALRKLRELLALAAANGRVAQGDLDRLISQE